MMINGLDNGHEESQICYEQSKTNLIINYLPQTITQDDVRQLFSTFGNIESCKLIRDKVTGQSLGYAFVNYGNSEDAERALNSLNGYRLQTKVIKVSYARPSSESIKGANLYVAGIPKNYTQADLESLFAPFGRIITSKILCDNSISSKGVGFIRFDQRSQAEKAIHELNGSIPIGSNDPIIVKFANNPYVNGKNLSLLSSAYLAAAQAVSRRLPTQYDNSNRYNNNITNELLPTLPLLAGHSSGWSIYIYNLEPDTEDEMLWKLFGPFGAVQNVKVIRDYQTNKCKGFGFVTMLNYDEAVIAVQKLNGFTLGNRVLQVSFKITKNKN